MKKITEYKGVIFDMDGVIVNNYHAHNYAWMEFCKEYELEVSFDEVKNFAFGRTNNEILPHFFQKELSKEEIAEYANQKEQIYRETYTNVKEVAGLSKLLVFLQKSGIKRAIATSAPAENVSYILEKTGLKVFFDAVSEPSQVKKGKPAPDIFLNAAALLQLQPSECLVFEDSPMGIQAAMAAKMDVIGLTTTHDALPFENLFTISDFNDLEISEINKMQ